MQHTQDVGYTNLAIADVSKAIGKGSYPAFTSASPPGTAENWIVLSACAKDVNDQVSVVILPKVFVDTAVTKKIDAKKYDSLNGECATS